MQQASAGGRFTPGRDEARRDCGSVVVAGETVQFEVRTIDARSEASRAIDARFGRPAGNVIVLVPGHGQTVDGPQDLLVAAADLSRSGIAFCVDPVPARGGDRTEAEAIAAISRAMIDELFPAAQRLVPIQATVVGWSHGGGEALRAAGRDPEIFPQYLGICPTGLVERRPAEMLCSFAVEGLRVLGQSLRERRWRCVVTTLRLGANLAAGLAKDLARSRSLKRLIADVRWACRRVPGPTFGYPGEVVLLWGEEDRVVRWRDAFPGCDCCQKIDPSLPAFTRENFPLASRVEVRVLPGGHISPETDAAAFLQVGLGLLGQLHGPQ